MPPVAHRVLDIRKRLEHRLAVGQTAALGLGAGLRDGGGIAAAMDDRQRCHHHEAPRHAARLERLIGSGRVRVERQRDHEFRIEVRHRNAHTRRIGGVFGLGHADIGAVGEHDRGQAVGEARQIRDRTALFQLFLKLARHVADEHGDGMHQPLFLLVQRGQTGTFEMLFRLRLRHGQRVAQTMRVELFGQFARAHGHVDGAFGDGQALLHGAQRHVIRRHLGQQREKDRTPVLDRFLDDPLALFHLPGNVPEQIDFPARPRAIGQNRGLGAVGRVARTQRPVVHVDGIAVIATARGHIELRIPGRLGLTPHGALGDDVLRSDLQVVIALDRLLHQFVEHGIVELRPPVLHVGSRLRQRIGRGRTGLLDEGVGHLDPVRLEVRPDRARRQRQAGAQGQSHAAEGYGPGKGPRQRSGKGGA
ncbi:hypothetical protein NBRC3293_3025 [Gluconobacter oxydans NBRC 3293]|uniref:Uncharacterized protein n=1 Tax=Gluconobacter oxydans NBRC 3293 TaxID=1315969 RepID=A0A829WP12_GLUOY|nr:hypothetical protein NBRC3293_3025 [Gluconobacter oxydans NBRC 3293]